MMAVNPEILVLIFKIKCCHVLLTIDKSYAEKVSHVTSRELYFNTILAVLKYCKA